MPSGQAERTKSFIDAAVVDHRSSRRGDFDQAREYLRDDAGLPQRSVHAALVVGDRALVAGELARRPELANERGGPKDWEPLLYVCFSRFLAPGPDQHPALEGIVQDLLRAGADPNAWYDLNGDPNARQTCLYGAAGIARHPGVTRLLLEAGADPNDGAPGLGPESLYHAAESPDTECLRLILEARPEPLKVSYCLGRCLDFENPEGVRLFLEHGADPNFAAPGRGGFSWMHGAIANGRGDEIVRLMLEHGGDPGIADASGLTPLRMALRYGRSEVVRLMVERGARLETATSADRLLGACFQGDRVAARQILDGEPGLVAGLGPADLAMLTEAAFLRRAEAVALMLEMGFPIDVPGRERMTALHWAAWNGDVALVEELVARGAHLERRNAYEGTPLGTCVWAAINVGGPADRPAVVRSLIRAGAVVAGRCRYPTGVPELDALLRSHFERS